MSLSLNLITDPVQLKFRTSECRVWFRKEERKSRLANWYLRSTERLDLKIDELSKIRQAIDRCKDTKLKTLRNSVFETKRNAAAQLAFIRETQTFHNYKMRANASVKANMETIKAKIQAMRRPDISISPIENVEEQLSQSSWVELKPECFPAQFSKLFKVERRSENIAYVPVTRCQAVFPGSTVDELKSLMCDTTERLQWDRNYAEFKKVVLEGCEDKEIFYHRVESNVMKLFGFRPRSFLYERTIEEQTSPHGPGVLIKFKSISQDHEPSSSSGKSVRGTIYHQSYQIHPHPEGSKLTITSVVDTGSNPPSAVVNLMCKMMAGQPYIWMHNHLSKGKSSPQSEKSVHIEIVCNRYHSASFL